MPDEYYDEGTNLDLKAWWGRVLWNWRWILLIMILCGAGGAWYALHQSGSTEKLVSQNTYEENIESAQEKLTDIQVSKLNGLYGQYIENIRQREIVSETLDNMYLMQMNPLVSAVKTVQYSVESSTVDIGSILCSLSASGEHESEIRSIIGADDRYTLDQLIEITKNSSNVSNTVMVEENNSNSSVVTVQIVADNRQETDQIYEIVKKEIDSIIAKVQKSYSNFSVTEMGSAYSLDSATVVLDMQHSQINQMNTDGNQFTALNSQISTLSGDELNYFNILLAGAEENTQGQTKNVDSSNRSAAQYGVLALISGFILSLVLYLIIFAAHGHVSAGTDPLPGILTVRVDSRLKHVSDPIRKQAIRIENPDYKNADNLDEQLAIVSSQVQFFYQRDHISRVFIYSETEDGIALRTAECIRKENEKITVRSGNMFRNSSKMTDFLNSEAIVILESARSTKEETVMKIARICSEKNKTIICSILSYE